MELRRRRVAAGLSLDGLAQAVRYSKGTSAGWRRGRKAPARSSPAPVTGCWMPAAPCWRWPAPLRRCARIRG
ncbi:hypothetical protein [Nonomuraea typhae]|uniref:XRE family transcriptional regulator n=1 Tax=Nonomuraea typhae TaxID=2603600 RepID=A0ABW7Z173_9ACTN